MNNSSEEYYDSSEMFHGSLSDIMGTRFDLVLIGKDKKQAIEVWNQIANELTRLHKMLNRFDHMSEISYINQNAFNSPIKLSQELWNILKDCEMYHSKTLGLFDITLQDFSLINFHSKDQSISLLKENIYLDLGGYAKGYAIEKILSILNNYDVKNCFVDFGNSAIFGLGNHPYGDSWKVSIENPYKTGEILNEFSLRNAALSTSGNTPGYTAHIVNPLDGSKNKDKKVICIQSTNPLDAEVLTTALMIANTHQREKILNHFETQQVIEFNL